MGGSAAAYLHLNMDAKESKESEWLFVWCFEEDVKHSLNYNERITILT